MEVGRLQHRPHPRPRPLEILVAVPEHERLTRGRLDEMKQHPQRRRLAGTVRPEEPGYRAPLQRERQIIDRKHIAETLAQMLGTHDGVVTGRRDAASVARRARRDR